MFKALAIKELRESAGIVVLGVLAAVYALSELTGTRLMPWQANRLYYYPFVSDSLSFYFFIVAGGLAIALGLRQTAWELGQGTYFFLLHRPVSRGRVFALKLIVGLGLTMVVSAALIAFYTLWMASPGNVQAPFYWSMPIPAVQMWIALPPIYLGAFLAGIRPGQWFGTRLLPLVTGIAITAAATTLPWVWSSLLVSSVGSVLLLVAIFYYLEHRDY